MTSLSIKPSRWKYSLLLICSLAFVASGIFILAVKGPVLVAWMSITFFGAGALIFLDQLIDARPRLLITEEGVFDRTLGIGTIPWHEIEGAYVNSISGNDFICLHLQNPEKYRARLSALKRSMTTANEKLGFTPFSLNLAGLAIDPYELLELIVKKIEERKTLFGGQAP